MCNCMQPSELQTIWHRDLKRPSAQAATRGAFAAQGVCAAAKQRRSVTVDCLNVQKRLAHRQSFSAGAG